MTLSIYRPEDYTDRLVELAEAVMLARQRVEFEILNRANAIKALAEHLQVQTGEQRIAVVGLQCFTLQRVHDDYRCSVSPIHAIATESTP